MRRYSVVLIFTLLVSVLVPATAQSEPKAPDSFVCLHPVDICRQAARQSGGDVEKAAEYLRNHRSPENYAPLDTEYGLTVNPGAGVPYYYGWRLSRNLVYGRTYEISVCDSQGNCTYQGDVGFQAQFTMNGRQIRLIRGIVTSELNTTAEIAQDMWCREKPSTSCGEQFTDFGPLPVGGRNIHDFSNLYLAEDHTYDLAFEFWIRTPGATAGLSPLHGSLDFQCDPLHDPDPDGIGECYYPHFAEGDSA